MSTRLVTISPSNVAQFKTVRLAALKDSPTAFGSTFAQESILTDADWLSRANRWSGDAGIGYLAIDAGCPVGILLGVIDERDAGAADAIGMWVAPTHRRHGVGRMLINAIFQWCSQKRVQKVKLMVTSSNEPAIAFYKRIGFKMTGNTEPYPNDPAIFEYEMFCAIATIAATASGS